MSRIPHYNEFVTLFLLSVDVICLTASAFLAAYFHPDIGGMPEAVVVFNQNFSSFMTVYLLWFMIGWTQGMFVSHRRDTLSYQLWISLKSTITTLALAYAIVSILTGTQPDTRFSLYFAGLVLLTVGGFRAALCIVLWLARQRGLNPRYVLIVGANERTANLIRILTERASFGYRIIGVLDDDPERMAHLKEFNLSYLGGFDEAENLLGDQVIDELHVCLPVRSHYETIQDLADLCMGLGVSLRMVADLFPLQLATSRLHTLEGIPMLSLTMVTEDAPRLALKRLIDILGSAVLLIGLGPLFLLVAFLIKVTSPGPVFFLQERVGLNQRKFNMIKFRSMVVDAEEKKDTLQVQNESDGPIFKIKNDPRVTSVGRWIRRFSIDELPQLVNVLKGDMSLVGPRPHPSKEVAKYNWHHRRRLSVKPGMTGLAQVSGRSSLAWEKTVDLDLTYIDTWSLWSDISILFRTVQAVATARGAT